MQYLMQWQFWLSVVVVSCIVHWAWGYFSQKGSGS